MKPYNEKEFNRLCAEFLGWKHYEGLNPSWNGSFETIQSDSYFFNRVYTKSELKFHSDWNWIMEVVEKIRVTYFQGLPFQFKINDETGYVYIVHHLMDNAYFIQVLIKDKLKEAVVEAIWQFLQFYYTNLESK
jgi:hypothetical protein